MSIASSMRLLLFLFLLVGSACSTMPSTPYRIAVDPYWSFLNAPGKEDLLYAFSTELLQQIAQKEELPLSLIAVPGGDLFGGLKERKYEGALSFLEPRLFLQGQYTFSDPLLVTGPVLMVREQSSFDGLQHLAGWEIAVVDSAEERTLLELLPGVLIRPYSSVAEALRDLSEERIDGALVDLLAARSYVHDLYEGTLKIATPPLIERSLRLLVLKGRETRLIRDFNRGIKFLKSDGGYRELTIKWRLDI